MSFLHGPLFQEGESGVRILPLKFSSVIGLVGVSDDADAEAFPLNKNVLIQSDADLSKLGSGWLYKHAEAIFKQHKTKVVIVRVAEGVDDAATLVNIIGTLADKTGVYKLLDASSEVKYEVGIPVAQMSDELDVTAALKVVAGRTLATYPVSAPESFTPAETEFTGAEAAKAYEAAIADKNAYVVYPKVVKMPSSVEVDSCVAAAMLMAETDYNVGPWESPSNKVIKQAQGTDPAIDFQYGEASCTANDLNENHVATIVHYEGYRLWGNHTAAPADEEQWRVVSVKRMSDMIKKTIKAGILWAQDKGITKTFVEDVVDAVNAVLRDLKTADAILGGECWAEPEINTVTGIKTGKIIFKYKFGAVYPGEQLVFIENLTDEYIADIFAAA